MQNYSSEKGQALIVITLVAVVLFSFTALAIDGSMVFSDKRHAQNAADTSALAGALAYARNNNADDDDDDDDDDGGGMNVIRTAARDRATSNGYDNGPTNDVTISAPNVPSDVCPSGIGKDITVTITSHVKTTFTRIIGREQMTNTVTATTRVCGRYHGPLFNGNAIVSLSPDGTGFDAHGTPDWTITGGGIFVNSDSASSATCGGSAGVTSPSVTAVGGTGFSCHTVNIGTITDNTGDQLTYSDYSSLLPREPICNGTATNSGGQWHPQSGADGSRVAFGGDMDFAPGLYCVTNSPGPYHGEITGSEITFYIMRSDFNMKLNGNGNSFTPTAPTSGEYKGIVMYLAPQIDANGNLLQTQEFDLRGNGDADIVGTIIAPSAHVTMKGNSGTDAFNSQIIAYLVDSGGNANINLVYDANENYQADVPNSLTLLQ